MRIPALAEGAPVVRPVPRRSCADCGLGQTLRRRQPCGASPPRKTPPLTRIGALAGWRGRLPGRGRFRPLGVDFIMKLGIPLASFSMHVTPPQTQDVPTCAGSLGSSTGNASQLD